MQNRHLVVITALSICVGLVFGILGVLLLLKLRTPEVRHTVQLDAPAQDDFIIMVAEAYASDGDLKLAEDRLTRLRDPDVAARVDRLASAYAPQRDLIAHRLAQLAVGLGSDNGALVAQSIESTPSFTETTTDALALNLESAPTNTPATIHTRASLTPPTTRLDSSNTPTERAKAIPTDPPTTALDLSASPAETVVTVQTDQPTAAPTATPEPFSAPPEASAVVSMPTPITVDAAVVTLAPIVTPTLLSVSQVHAPAVTPQAIAASSNRTADSAAPKVVPSEMIQVPKKDGLAASALAIPALNQSTPQAKLNAIQKTVVPAIKKSVAPVAVPNPTARIVRTSTPVQKAKAQPASAKASAQQPVRAVSQNKKCGTGTFAWPVRGALSQKYWSKHLAIDIAVRTGTVVRTSDSGVVTFSGWDETGFGRRIVIDHCNGWVTLYAHMESLAVKAGAVVAKGALIGRSGNTGHSSGPHLHFQLERNGRMLNPLQYLK